MSINRWFKSFYGINFTRSFVFYSKFGLNSRCSGLNLKKFSFIFTQALKSYLIRIYLLERLLRIKLTSWFKFLFKLGGFKIFRLSHGLPVNGQKSRTNGKTSKKLNLLRVKNL